MSGRRVTVERLTLHLPPGSRVDTRAVAQEIARALAAAPQAEDRTRLAIVGDAPRRGEAATAFARRIGRATAATLTRRGGHDGG